MSTCLKIGDRLLDGDRIITALIQYELLEPLVGQLLLDEAIEEIPFSHEEVFANLIGSNEIPMPEDFDRFLLQWCELKNVTPAYLSGVIVRQMRIEKFKQIQFAAQVESEFLHNKSKFEQVEYSLIQTDDLLLAQELYFQLRDDEVMFSGLAHQYSLGSERETEGRVGPVPLAMLPDPIADRFRGQPIGKVYEPIAIDDRYWIVRLEQLTAAHLTESTRKILINQMYNQWLQSQVKALLSQPDAIAYGQTETVRAETVQAETVRAETMQPQEQEQEEAAR